MKKLLIIGLCFGALTATAFGEKLTLTSPMWVGNKQLQPGSYKIEMKGDKVVFIDGKTSVAEVPATVEPTGQKTAFTSVESRKDRVNAIRLGGSMTKIVLKQDAAAQ